MKIPPGFDNQGKDGKVCKLRKSLYGLKQSPRAWFNQLTRVLKRYEFLQCQSDHTLFVKFSKEGKRAIIIMYVDDIIITGNYNEEINNAKRLLAKEFEVKDLRFLKYFLGMEIARSKRRISVTQRKYVLDLLKGDGYDWVQTS